MHSAKLKLAATCLMWKIPNRRFWMWSFDLSWSATVSVGSMNESLECTIGLAAEMLKIRRMRKMHNLFWIWISKALDMCDICVVTPTSKQCTCARDQAVLHVLVPAVILLRGIPSSHVTLRNSPRVESSELSRVCLFVCLFYESHVTEYNYTCGQGLLL